MLYFGAQPIQTILSHVNCVYKNLYSSSGIYKLFTDLHDMEQSDCHFFNNMVQELHTYTVQIV